MQEVLRQQGVRGLYRGLTPAVTLSTTEASIRYGIYGVCQDFVRKTLGVANSENMSLVQNALAGGLTGFLATFASCPIELVKCRMQGMMEMAEKSGSKQHQLRYGHQLSHSAPRLECLTRSVDNGSLPTRSVGRLSGPPSDQL